MTQYMENKKVVIVKSVEELELFAMSFLSELCETLLTNTTGSKVFGLSGDLGAGKTTFSKAVAKELGIQEVVTSPTFGIQKQYKVLNPKYSEIFSEFVHIDAYRIENIKETEPLRFIELFQRSNTLIFIEWPEKIAEILPKDTIMLSFESIDENTRKISY
ncbi:MAG: tRNA threonylcarbamoyladenosine biosynthesis protein TsaE [Patescibacteria group bacterium]|nr:tRNA threonylcarbamoyladenosine biosynthesis protein TsaE [Patescibacteria group bacterium]